MSLSHFDCYQLAKSAGLGDSQAKMAAAIAMVESGGDPNQHNYNPSTGDDSYGLWQINMLGSMGPTRRKQFGISDNSQLYNPETNARAMAIVSQDGGNFSPWSTYPVKATAYMNSHLIQTSGSGPDGSGGNWVDKLLPGSPVSTAETIAQGFNKVAAWVSNSDNWVRVAYVAGGSVVVIVGLVMIVGSSKAGSVITGVTPVGKVSKIAKVGS